MVKSIFTGVCTALITPFLNNEINFPMLERLIDRQLRAGVSTIVLSGTTGESPTLTEQEKTDMIKRAKAFVGNDCTIIAGTGTNSTSHAILLSHQAEEAGADGLLVVAPYYNKSNTPGLIQHFTAVANSVQIPVILYNVPSRTGIDIPVKVYSELSQIPNIVGVKEATTDLTKISKIRYSCPDSFRIWSGNDDLTVPIMSLGGDGIVSVLSNLCPEEMVEMTNAMLIGDHRTAACYQIALQPLIDLLFAEVNPIPIKYAMRYAGFDCGDCRLPLGQISPSLKKRIDTFLA